MAVPPQSVAKVLCFPIRVRCGNGLDLPVLHVWQTIFRGDQTAINNEKLAIRRTAHYRRGTLRAAASTEATFNCERSA